MWYFYHQESLKQTSSLILSLGYVSELSVEVVENTEGWVVGTVPLGSNSILCNYIVMPKQVWESVVWSDMLRVRNLFQNILFKHSDSKASLSLVGGLIILDITSIYWAKL